MKRISGGYALILGATKGLGKELKLALHQNLIVVGRTASASRHEHLNSNKNLFLSCDLADLDETPSSVMSLISRLESLVLSGGVITSFYWAAGVSERKTLEKLSQESLLQMIDVNFRNSAIIASWVWKHMKTSNLPSSFVVISSTTGITSTPKEDEPVYAATKAAQVSFARAIGKNNKNTNIKVSLFCPGGMKTPFWNGMDVDENTYSSFLDPKKVAVKIIEQVENQSEPYLEAVIPRGSL